LTWMLNKLSFWEAHKVVTTLNISLLNKITLFQSSSTFGALTFSVPVPPTSSGCVWFEASVGVVFACLLLDALAMPLLALLRPGDRLNAVKLQRRLDQHDQTSPLAVPPSSSPSPSSPAQLALELSSLNHPPTEAPEPAVSGLGSSATTHPLPPLEIRQSVGNVAGGKGMTVEGTGAGLGKVTTRAEEGVDVGAGAGVGAGVGIGEAGPAAASSNATEVGHSALDALMTRGVVPFVFTLHTLCSRLTYTWILSWLFGGCFPMLYWLTFLSRLLLYQVEKWSLLHRDEYVPHYGDSLMVTAYRWMLLGTAGQYLFTGAVLQGEGETGTLGGGLLLLFGVLLLIWLVSLLGVRFGCEKCCSTRGDLRKRLRDKAEADWALLYQYEDSGSEGEEGEEEEIEEEGKGKEVVGKRGGDQDQAAQEKGRRRRRRKRRNVYEPGDQRYFLSRQWGGSEGLAVSF